MSHLLPEHDDLILFERDRLDGGIRVSVERLAAFSEALDEDLARLTQRWQHLAAPRAVLAERRITRWR